MAPSRKARWPVARRAGAESGPGTHDPVTARRAAPFPPRDGAAPCVSAIVIERTRLDEERCLGGERPPLSHYITRLCRIPSHDCARPLRRRLLLPRRDGGRRDALRASGHAAGAPG